MRTTLLCQLFGVALLVTPLIGCGGSNSGPAKPAADMDELQQYLADNPDQNVDIDEEAMEADLADDE